MQVLAINQNATIERLVSLSSGKMGYTLHKYADVESAEANDYGFVLMDSDLYSDGNLETLKNIAPKAIFILIVSKGAEKPTGFDVYLEKPFLPTEMVDIFTKEQDRLLSSNVNEQDASLALADDDVDVMPIDTLDSDDSALVVHDPDELTLDAADEPLGMELAEEEEPLSLEEEPLSLGEELTLDAADEPLGMELAEEEEPLSLEDISQPTQEQSPVLDSEDVSEIKNLLEDESGNGTDDFDSLNENMVANALGVEIDGDTIASETFAQEIDEPQITHEDIDIVEEVPQTSNEIVVSSDTHATEDIVKMLIDALKGDNVTINLTITKK